MRDLDKALADILAIRSQIAAGTAFRGYGPATVAATSGIALLTAVVQFLWLDDPTSQPIAFFAGWAAAALISAALIWIEMQARSRRHHSGLADAMVQQAIEQFLPAGVAGVLLAIMLWKFAPEALWMLPGLWQVMVSLGVFASVRSLPRTIALGATYEKVLATVAPAIADAEMNHPDVPRRPIVPTSASTAAPRPSNVSGVSWRNQRRRRLTMSPE